jgi:hypothetical protein
MSHADNVERILQAKIQHVPPPTDEEVNNINMIYKFNEQDIMTLFRHQHSLNLLAEKGKATVADKDWLALFKVYCKSKAWKKQLGEGIEKANESFGNNSVNFGKQARVIVAIMAPFGMPAIGEVGEIVRGKFQYDKDEPHKSAYEYWIRFAIPCRLVGGGLAINDDIVDQEDYVAFHDYMEEVGAEFLMWEKKQL